jgi:hypothetical protein
MPSAFPGLCADCAFSRVVDSGRSRFYLCERALTDSRFRKYPPLPVLSCPGFERKETPGTPAVPKPDDKLT